MDTAIDTTTDTTVEIGVQALAARDPAFAAALARIGSAPPQWWPHGFPTLLRIVVNQQISNQAAAAILTRLEALAPGLDPVRILALSDDALRGTGLSRPKIDYGRTLAAAVRDGQLDLEALCGPPPTTRRWRCCKRCAGSGGGRRRSTPCWRCGGWMCFRPEIWRYGSPWGGSGALPNGQTKLRRGHRRRRRVVSVALLPQRPGIEP